MAISSVMLMKIHAIRGTQMSRLIKFQIALALLVFASVACSPTAISSASGTNPAVLVETVEATVKDVTPIPVSTTVELSALKVSDVQIQIGVGSPIPVDAFISGELPDTCAQLSAVNVAQTGFAFEIKLHVAPGTREDCFRDTLPFRMMVPLNMVSLPNGTYSVKVNDASTTFKWPSTPNITPEPAAQTYRNALVGFEFDYPLGWLLDHAGDVGTLWSERPVGPGKEGVPANIAKIDVISEINSTMSLEELVARQKKDLMPEQIKSEQTITLPGGLPAVRLEVSAFADSASLLTIINGHPVMIVNYGDTGHFDEITNSLRPVQPQG